MNGNSSDPAKKTDGADHDGPSHCAYPAPNERAEESKRENRNRPRNFLSRSRRCWCWLGIRRSFPKQTSTEAAEHEDDTGNTGECGDECSEDNCKNDRDSRNERCAPRKQEQRDEFKNPFHTTSNRYETDYGSVYELISSQQYASVIP